MKTKLFVLATLLAIGGSLFGQGTPVKNIYGSGTPNANLASVVGTTYVDQSTSPATVYTCTAVVQTATLSQCTWTAAAGGASGVVGGTFGSSNSSLYTLAVSAGTISAINSKTGVVDYSGADVAVILNNIINANASTCGTINIKNGVYNISSATLETLATSTLLGGSLYYGIAFPANAGSASQYCQWRLIGEQAPYVAGLATQNQGTIFKATAAARTAAVANTNMIAYFWHRPDIANSVGNDIFIENIGFQGVDNQRGNECAFCFYEAGTTSFKNVAVEMAPNWGSPVATTITPAVAGTNRTIAFQSTQNNHNNWQWFEQTWAEGADIGYDVESEHSLGFGASSVLCTNAGILGRIVTSRPITHPGTWTKFTDQETINGWTFGANMARGSTINFITYDFELLSSTAFARVNNFTETNTGYSSGIINYESVNAGAGGTNISPAVLFSNAASGGGAGFTKQQSNTPLGTPNPTVFDNFAGTFTALGPAWIQCVTCGGGSGLATTAGVVSPVAGSAVDVASAFEGQAFNNDQFAQIKVVTINAADTIGVWTDIPAGASGFPGTRSGYKYVVSTSGGAVPNRAVYKIVNNVATLLLQTPAASGVGVGDIIELDHVGGVLRAYYTPSGGQRILDLSVADATFTNGYPGLSVQSNVLNQTKASNFVAGNITAETNNNVGSPNRLIPGDFVSNTYGTLTECLAAGSAAAASLVACGSASNGLFSIPITTPTSAVVTTTALTQNSTITVQQRLDTTLGAGAALAVTCNTTPNTTAPNVTARTATTFTITFAAFTTNPGCYQYDIKN